MIAQQASSAFRGMAIHRFPVAAVMGWPNGTTASEGPPLRPCLRQGCQRKSLPALPRLRSRTSVKTGARMVAADYAKETVIPMPTAAAASGASSGMLSSPYLVAAGMDMEVSLSGRRTTVILEWRYVRTCTVHSSSLTMTLIAVLLFSIYTNHFQLGTIASQILNGSSYM